MEEVKDTGRQPWEQMPEEPGYLYERFLAFLDLGTTRTVSLLYRKLVGENKVATATWHDDAKTWQWHARAEAFDSWSLNKRRLDKQDAADEALKRHAAMGALLQKKGLERLKEVDPAKLPKRMALDWLRLGIALERDALLNNDMNAINTQLDALLRSLARE